MLDYSSKSFQKVSIPILPPLSSTFFLVPCKTISVRVVYNKLRYDAMDGWMLYAALSPGGWMA